MCGLRVPGVHDRAVRDTIGVSLRGHAKLLHSEVDDRVVKVNRGVPLGIRVGQLVSLVVDLRVSGVEAAGE